MFDMLVGDMAAVGLCMGGMDLGDVKLCCGGDVMPLVLSDKPANREVGSWLLVGRLPADPDMSFFA